MEPKSIYLQWFRDKGEGQEAANCYGAEQIQDGLWPIARLHCDSAIEAEMKWDGLLGMFKVNAMTYYIM